VPGMKWSSSQVERGDVTRNLSGFRSLYRSGLYIRSDSDRFVGEPTEAPHPKIILTTDVGLIPKILAPHTTKVTGYSLIGGV